MRYLQDYPIEEKKVLVRVDYNVPIEKGHVTDDRRIRASLPTIEYLLSKRCRIILATHLGRPEGKVVSELKLDALTTELQKLLPDQTVIKLDDCIGPEVRQKVESGSHKQIFLLENLRFYQEEENNNPAFAHALASLADVYVNEAFSVSHRAHASVQAITHFLPGVAGFQLQKEIQNLSKALRPLRPAVWIMGGAKLDKLLLVQKALDTADYILVGGALAFAFLKAQGIPVGMSKIDVDSVERAKEILQKKEARKIILPLDFVVVEKFSSRAPCKVVRFNQINNTQMGLDLGPATIKLFEQYLRKAQTIVWNGPLGYYEWANFALATKEIGRYIGKLTAISICGGGETADALHNFYLDHHFTHVSTGGGAALEFLSGIKLPGLVALEENEQKFR